MEDKSIRQYYTVTDRGSFYYDMVGYEVKFSSYLPKSEYVKRIDFGGTVGQSVFYNEQLMHYGDI